MIWRHLPLVFVLALFNPGCLDARQGTEREDDATSGADTAPSDVDTTVPDGSDREDTMTDPGADSDGEAADSEEPTDTQNPNDTADTRDSEVFRPACPVAVIDLEPGTEVAPGTTLRLDGSQSYSSEGPIVRYHWEVEQPIGSASVFRPSGSISGPTIDVNVVGVYKIRLSVMDEGGTASCVPDEVTVFVNPTEALFIELLWQGRAPEGPNGDSTGPDLDLHFAHPFAFDDEVGEGWFDRTFDTFWYNPAPNWGQLDPAVDDDPVLVRESQGGRGPEVLTMSNPQAGTTYRVGVHLWHDHGFTEVTATVRIYIYGNLAFEMSGVELGPRDFWEAALIHWGEARPPELVKACEGTAQACQSDSDCGEGRCTFRIGPMNPTTLPAP